MKSLKKFLVTMLTIWLVVLTSCQSSAAQTVVIEPHSIWLNQTDSVYFAQPERQFRRLVMKAALADTAQKLFVEAYTERKLLQVRLEESRATAGRNLFIAIGAGVLAAVALLLR